MKHACYCMSCLFDQALKEKYNSMKINDPLVFIKNAIDWDAFTPLLKDLYRNDTDRDFTSILFLYTAQYDFQHVFVNHHCGCTTLSASDQVS